MYIINIFLVNFRVCNVNFRVGDRIRFLVLDLVVCVLSFLNIGIRKVVVFLFLVLVIVIIFFFFIIKGIV